MSVETKATHLIAEFLKHVHSDPELTAIMTTDTSWTYQALYADVLAWKARIHVLKPKTPVLLCLHRTPQFVSIVLALQWLEIAYIPVDPQTPLERMRAIIDDSKAEVLIHDTKHHEAYLSLPCDVYSRSDLEQTEHNTHDIIATELNSKRIAYVIYTSGSTGTPKGVSVSRGALDNFLASMSHYFLNQSNEILLATTTFTFDIAALELYLPLWQKKTLFLASEKEYKDPLVISNLLQEYPITLLQGTPSFWNMLGYSGWSGKKDLTALCGGEPLTSSMIKQLLPCVASLWNMYGPTEATIWCALKQILSDKKPVTVGAPIHNLEMYVLGDAMQILPVGAKGELYIGGLGVAEGYFNNPNLTKEKFVAYKQALGGRLYRTGDIACMTEEGEFIIHGRVDNQVKLHGYRIELEDIEAHIQAVQGVHASAVVVHQEQLVAYVCVSNEEAYSEACLIHALSRELPAFMVPNRFIYLERLPLNSSGKLNRKALPEPYHEMHHVLTHMTPIQASLCDIWCDVLGVTGVSINDNFFELGGHSLLAVRIVMKVRQVFGKVLHVSDVYQAPSILEFSDVVMASPEVEHASEITHKASVSSWLPLTDFQFMLWISNLFTSDVNKLNVVGRRRIVGALDQTALDLALNAVVQKHDVLSYTLHRFLPTQKKQVKHARQTLAWEKQLLLVHDEEVIEVKLSESMHELHDYQAWSRKKPLLLARLFYLTEQRVEIQIAMPHMIADQQSLEIFFHDLSSAYLFYSRALEADLNIEGYAFESYVRHDHQVVRSALRRDEAFWSGYLKDAKFFSFPEKHMLSSEEKIGHVYSSFFEIDDKRLQIWRNFCVEHAVTLNDFLCAAIGLTLRRCCEDDMVLPEHVFVNMVKSTREDPGYDDVIGCFLRAQPIKLKLNSKKSMKYLAKEVQNEVLETSTHQYASSLIKLAAVGDIKFTKHRTKPFLISLITALLGDRRQEAYYLSSPMLNACKRLAKLDRKRGFVVNVNIWDSFFSTKNSTKNQLFGHHCQSIAADQKDIFNIDDVLDVCLFKDTEKNKSYLALSANLKPAFREQLGQVLLEVLSV